jgi:hypothetical protein
LAGTREAEQFLGAHHGIFGPWLIDLVVRILDFQIRIEGCKKLRPFQMVEVSADLRSCKDAPDLTDECR